MDRERAWLLGSGAAVIVGSAMLTLAMRDGQAGGYASGAMLAWIGVSGLIARPSALREPDAAVRIAAWILGAGVLIAVIAWTIAPAFRGTLVARLGPGAVLYGATAVGLGYTRRLGSELVRAKCGYGYDLIEQPRTCAECGTQLWPRAVVRGRRERHPHLMGVGAVLLVLGLALSVPGLKLGVTSLAPTPALVGMGIAHTLDAEGYTELANRKISGAEADQIAAAILGPSGTRQPTPAESNWIVAAITRAQLGGATADNAILAAVRPRIRLGTISTVPQGKVTTNVAQVLFECDADFERARDVFVAIGSPPNQLGGGATTARVEMVRRVATDSVQPLVDLQVADSATRVVLPVRIFVLTSKTPIPSMLSCDPSGAPMALGTEAWGINLELSASLAPQLPGSR